jgi:hypothetical protein
MTAITPSPLYRLVDRDLLRKLMQRTSNGESVSIRELGEAAGVHHSTIGHLLSGIQKSVPMDVAHAITNRIGCGVLMLFAPPLHADTTTVLVEAMSA